MSTPDSHGARWAHARAVAEELAETGVDPLDRAAAQTARSLLVRRFVLDLLLIFAVVAIVGAVGLMLFRMVGGEDPLDGREIWIASAALIALLVILVVRSRFASPPRAYESAWAGFVDRVWPGAPKGDELGAARLRFVQQIADGGSGAFPSAAPGRKA